MSPPNLLTYPQTLIEGHEYLLLEKNHNGTKSRQSMVTFVAYTSFPAVIVVRSGDGVRHRCLRKCLIEVQALVHYGLNNLSRATYKNFTGQNKTAASSPGETLT